MVTRRVGQVKLFGALPGGLKMPRPLSRPADPHRLKAEIERLGLPRKDLASFLEVTEATISNWLNGRTSMPPATELALDIFLGDFERGGATSATVTEMADDRLSRRLAARRDPAEVEREDQVAKVRAWDKRRRAGGER
jgi:transcriptional regulator with XRE-family HTH domain